MHAAHGPAVEVAVRTDPGRDPEKQVNEDAYAEMATRFGHLVLVCDGMGGHAGGREASELAVRTVREVFDQAPDGSLPRELLANAAREANRRVYRMTSPEEAEAGRPGSTLVAALVHAGGVEVAHVGDSRAYLVHAGQIFQLTKDHSMVQRMVDDGLITPAEAARHPEANKILRALGIAPDVEVELRPQPVVHAAGDVLVLCSDGLSDLVRPEEILAVAGAAPPEQAAGQLVDLANARGGHDNITVAVARAREGAVRARDPVAPTVPQTQVLVPPVTPPRAAAPTVLQSPAPPAPSGNARPSSSRLAIRIAGVAIGLVGVAVAGVAFYLHNEERRGARRTVPDVQSEPIATPSAPPEVNLTPLPHAPAAPTTTTASEDAAIAPLFVEPDAGVRHRRRRPEP